MGGGGCVLYTICSRAMWHGSETLCVDVRAPVLSLGEPAGGAWDRCGLPGHGHGGGGGGGVERSAALPAQDGRQQGKGRVTVRGG